MPGWSDIYAIAADSKEDSAGFAESTARITALLDAEKVVFLCFAQGTEAVLSSTICRLLSETGLPIIS